MSVPLQLALYLAVGIGSDLLVTGYYLAVARGWSWAASLVSIPIALCNLWVVSRVLTPDPSWPNAVAYAVGNAVGCFCIMAVSKKIRRRLV